MTTLVTVGGDRDYPGHVPTGPIARALVARLASDGDPVRVLAVPSEATDWPAGVEVVVGDIAAPARSASAFEGIERLFLAGAVPETVREAVTLARRGGVQRIVVLSSHGPDVEIEFTPDSWYWLAIEVVVERSGARWTHLQPSPIMAQTLTGDYPDTGSDLAARIRAGEPVREADPDEPYPLTHEDDVAAVAVAALGDDDYAGQTLTVHGEPISLRAQLDLIGQSLGRRIVLEEPAPDEAGDVEADGYGDWPGGDAAVIDETVGDGFDEQWMADGVAALTRVLGRPPRTFADWVTDNVDAFR